MALSTASTEAGNGSENEGMEPTSEEFSSKMIHRRNMWAPGQISHPAALSNPHLISQRGALPPSLIMKNRK
jgi:hypothetical protein